MCKVITQRFHSAQESFQKAEEGKTEKTACLGAEEEKSFGCTKAFRRAR